MDTNIFEETPIKKKKKKIVIVKKPTPKPKRKRRTKAETRAAAIARGINPDQKKLGELITAYDRLKIKPKGQYVRGKKKKLILNKPKPAPVPKSKKPPPPKKEKKIKPPKPPVKKRRTKLQVLAAIKAAGIDSSLTLKQQKERLKTLDKARAKVKKKVDKKKAEADAIRRKKMEEEIEKKEAAKKAELYYERMEREQEEQEAASKKRREDFMNGYRDGITGYGRVTALVYKKRKYLLNGDTDVLYGVTETKVYEMGDAYNYNWNFKYVDTKRDSVEWDWP